MRYTEMRNLLLSLLLVFSLVLASCATVPSLQKQDIQTVVTETSGQEILKLAVAMAVFTQEGYSMGDWVDLQVAGLQLRVQLSPSALPDRYCLVPGDKNSILYGPLALSKGQEVVIAPAGRMQGPPVGINFSGSFLFTF